MSSKRTARHQRAAVTTTVTAKTTSTTEPLTSNVTTETPAADPMASLDTVSLSTALTVVGDAATQPATEQEQPATNSTQGTETDVTKQPEPEQPVAETKPDPFADLPTIQVAGVALPDLSKAVKVSDPRKYSGVHTAAVAESLQTKKGWKHANVVFKLGTNKKERKPTSVHGMIDVLVAAAGKEGLPAPVLVSRLRMGQIGNKRSHFCEGLPPVGWAEGWIDSAVTKNHIRSAGQITAAQAAEMKGETEAAPAAEAA